MSIGAVVRNICSSLQSREKDIVHAQECEIVLVPDDDNVILKEREQINSYLERYSISKSLMFLAQIINSLTATFHLQIKYIFRDIL